jgi:hypothetical protein
MNFRAASLVIALVIAPFPAYAQGAPGSVSGAGAIQTLTRDLAALTARVSKLEGNIVPADLVGTYTLAGISIPMQGAVPGVRPAAIVTEALMARLTLNANGSITPSPLPSALPRCGRIKLTQGSWALTDESPLPGETCDEESPFNPTWSYADGILTLNTEENEAIPFSMAAGGRFGIVSFAGFHPQEASSDTFMLILSRLQ